MDASLAKVGGSALVALFLSSLAFAQQPLRPAPVHTTAVSDDTAASDYVLNCAGCHGLNGAGDTAKGIPDFRGSIGLFTRTKRGRAYLIRVPGSADALLADTRLAALLNWIVASYDATGLASGFQPFSAGEVGRLRDQHFADPARVRRSIAAQLRALGLEPSPYTYGNNESFRAREAKVQ